jgi:hypothetical protein
MQEPRSSRDEQEQQRYAWRAEGDEGTNDPKRASSKPLDARPGATDSQADKSKQSKSSTFGSLFGGATGRDRSPSADPRKTDQAATNVMQQQQQMQWGSLEAEQAPPVHESRRVWQDTSSAPAGRFSNPLPPATSASMPHGAGRGEDEGWRARDRDWGRHEDRSRQSGMMLEADDRRRTDMRGDRRGPRQDDRQRGLGQETDTAQRNFDRQREGQGRPGPGQRQGQGMRQQGEGRRDWGGGGFQGRNQDGRGEPRDYERGGDMPPRQMTGRSDGSRTDASYAAVHGFGADYKADQKQKYSWHASDAQKSQSFSEGTRHSKNRDYDAFGKGRQQGDARSQEDRTTRIVYDEEGFITDIIKKKTDEEVKKEQGYLDAWEESLTEDDEGMQFRHIPKEILRKDEPDDDEEQDAADSDQNKYAGEMTKEIWDEVANEWTEICAQDENATYGAMPQSSVWWNTFSADCGTFMPSTQEQMDGMRIDTARFIEVIFACWLYASVSVCTHTT